MARQRIPLVGSLTNRVVSGVPVDTKDQIFQNCFPEITRNAITGKGSVQLIKRSGYELLYTVATSTETHGVGHCVWTGSSTGYSVFSVHGLSFLGQVKVYDETGTILGAAFAGYKCWSLTETLISNVPTLVAVVTSNAGGTLTEVFWYQAGGAWTLVVGVPALIVGEPVHKDGFMFVMDQNGRIWNSDLNSVTSWTATSYIDASSVPDLGAGLAVTGEYIVAFGKASTQFFKNAGNATGSPLQRVPLTFQIGVTLAANSAQTRVVQIGEKVLFVGSNKEDSATAVYMLNGTELTKISNAEIDNRLNATTATGGAFGGALIIGGMTHAVMTRTSTDLYAYCFDTKTWWVLDWAFVNSPIGRCSGRFIFSNRKIYKASTAYLDDGDGIVMTIQTQNTDQGTNRKKFFTSAELICDSQTTSGNISISWSDDDYATFSTARTIDPSTEQKRIHRLGSTQRRYNNKRAWKITETVNRPFRGEAIDIEYEVADT